MSEEVRSVLVAEDDKPMAHALETKLIHAGFSVVVVDNGECAMEELQKHAFDLLVCDLVMPKKNGFDVVREIRASGNQIPIIISSNLSQEEDKKRIRELGANDYFSKADITINEVVDHIKALLKPHS